MVEPSPTSSEATHYFSDEFAGHFGPPVPAPSGYVDAGVPTYPNIYHPPKRWWGITWREKLGDELNKPNLCEDIPDFIVADIKKLNATEDSVLRKVAKPLEFPLSYEDSYDIGRLKWKFENDPDSFSMSLPQIGISKRVMCYFRPTELKKTSIKDKFPVFILINPSYEPVGDEVDLDYEKCHSVKDIVGLVSRFETIKYKYYNIWGDFFEKEAFGLRARWIQHEIDHMNGLLFIDQALKIITIKEHRFRRSIGKVEWSLGV